MLELVGGRTAATVKLLGKRINNESRARRSGSKQGRKKRRRKRRRSDFLLTIFLKYGIIPLSNEGDSPEAVSTSRKKEVVFMRFDLIELLAALLEEGYIISFRVTKSKIYVAIKNDRR